MARNCKYHKTETKVSYDDGQTWESKTPPVYHMGGLIEAYSQDCESGTTLERWITVEGDYLCDGNNKWTKQLLQNSYDGGVTWYASAPTTFRLGEFVEVDEEYCLYASEAHYIVPDMDFDKMCEYYITCPRWYRPTYRLGSCYCRYVDPIKIVKCSTDTITENHLSNGTYNLYSLKIGECTRVININSNSTFASRYMRPYLTSIDTTNAVNLETISDNSFRNCSGLTSIVIPNSVVTIGNSAFSGCPAMTSVTISNAQCSIGNSGFEGCTSLANLNIGNGVTSVGNNAFSYCSGLTSVNIPSGVTYIGESAFSNCSTLTDVVISNAPCSIGRYAFTGCTSLSGLTLGNSFTSIGEYAFGGCANITSNITIPSTVTSIGSDAFSGCSGITNITIQEGVTSIGGGAFNNTSITDLTIPNSVSGNVYSYSSSVFPKGCQYLTGVTIGSGITSAITDYIAESPVSYLSLNCSTVSRKSSAQAILPFEHVILGDNVTSLGDESFYGASHLKTVEIGSGVTNIGYEVFSSCSSLESINIPSGVTSIGNYGFWSCRSLSSCTIGNGVTSIGESAFRYCSGLTSITVEATTPPTLGNYAFDNTNDCPIYVPAASMETYKTTRGWSSYASRIRAIPKFSGKWLATYNGGTTSSAECDSTSAITNGEVITTNLTTIEIGKCVTSVGENAFQGCSSLTSIDLPISITSIGTSTFENCTSLTSITCLATTPPTLGSHTFDNTNNSPIYVLPDSLSVYQTASGWSDYASRIQAITFKLLATYSDSSISRVSCNDNTTLTSGETRSLPTLISAMTSADIGSCVTSIGWGAFSGCTSLANASIGSGVTSIDWGAFSGCTSLASIVIPDSVTSIGEIAFNNCSSLSNLTIGSGVTSIGRSAFGNCTSLTSIDIPYSGISFGDYAFAYCTSLTSCTLPNGITQIAASFLDGCTSLPSITIPNSVTSIGNSAFYGCRGLTNITIPSGITSIGSRTFFSCSGLTSVDIPSSITSIGERAFQNCSGLTSVTVEATTPPTLGSNAFAFTPITSRGYIYVPSASVETYKAASGWSTYSTRIRAIT